MQQNTFSQRIKLGLSCLLSFVMLFLACYFLGIIRFEQNDDVMMLLLASGAYTGEPEYRLVFMNPMLGHLLNALYQGKESIEWYTWLLSTIQILAFASLAKRVLEYISHKHLRTLSLILLGLFFLRFSILLQFTTAAAVTALAGILAIALKKRFSFLGVLYFFLAALIRFEAAMLMALIAIPCLILFQWVQQHKFNWRWIPLLATTIIILWFRAEPYEAYYLEKNEWSQYTLANEKRTLIQDFPQKSLLKSDSETWTACQQLYVEYMYQTPVSRYSIDPSQFLSQINSISGIDQALMALKQLGVYFPWILALGILVFGACMPWNRKKLVLLVPACLALTCLFYIGSYALIKFRVFISVALVLFVLTAILHAIKSEGTSRMLFLGMMLFALGLCYSVVNSTALTSQMRSTELGKQQDLLEGFRQKTAAPIEVFGADYKIQFEDAFNISQVYREQAVIFNGWLAGIPYHNKILNQDRGDKAFIFVANSHLVAVKDHLKSCPYFKKGGTQSLRIYMQNEVASILEIEDIP